MPVTARRSFFTAISQLFKDEDIVIRPPYAVMDTTFEACKTCDAMCVSECEEKIIRLDTYKMPFLDFNISGCSDCKKCLEACVPNVLNDSERFIQAKAEISIMSCISHHDTICFSCKEPCLDDAIVFQGMFRPIIIPQKCTGCGYCVAVCPSKAIQMSA